MPANRVGSQKMSEQTGDVSESICFVSVNRVVVVCEGVFEQICPKSVQFGETLAYETEELRICLFLGTAFHNHRWQLRFLACRQLHLHQLVAGFFKVQARHDCKVNCSSQIDQVGVCLVFDLHRTLLHGFFIVTAFITSTFAVVLGITVLA